MADTLYVRPGVEGTKQCLTCLHLVTHDKCKNCLYKPDEKIEGTDYRYHNWEHGTWLQAMAQSHAREVAGTKHITIGGQGEADILATHTPEETAANLRRVAEQCGYVVGNLIPTENIKQLSISTHDGSFVITWIDDVLHKIDGKEWSWNRGTDYEAMHEKLERTE